MQGLTIQPHIVIGTPGRLKQVIADQQAIDLSNVKQVVFDEADMLLKEGYFNDIDTITNLLNKPQYMVFSATLENNLRYKLEQYVGNDILVIMEDKMTSHNVKHYLVDIKHTWNRAKHSLLVTGHDPYNSVFCEVATKVPGESLWEDSWVKQWIAAKCKL